MKLYGNVANRINANQMYCEEIEVGTEMTLYHYSDRDAYEVVEVTDQKHIKVRKYDAKALAPYSNEWELTSNPNNKVRTMVKRRNKWYFVEEFIYDEEEIKKSYTIRKLWRAGIKADELKEKGKITKYEQVDVSFGIADHYFDYSF